ncbi:hypothetical protein L1987_48371 [Smallanthus sonchifolius]|uniref:Uncharacterized protein n=1 Tax=Smallanthus sonchifolius TaxID=185202 RepID=A0ACB9FRT7_9ASTR|nr:hypothetical protein L1987_48371 [Smallanthus sonchifolius]
MNPSLHLLFTCLFRKPYSSSPSLTNLSSLGLSCKISVIIHLIFPLSPASPSSEIILAFGMDLVFVKRHNVCAFLNSNDPKAAEFIPVLNFLANSNISFAISHNLPVFEATIRQFWETAEIITIDDVQHIRATVHGQEEKFLAYPRFLQIIINHLLPEIQQGGNTFVFDNMIAKTLSYMKSTSKRTNRAIADIPLFGHVIGEEEEFILDIDPDLEEEDLSSDEELEAEIDIDIPVVQEEEQQILEPVIEAPFVEEIQVVHEPAVIAEADIQEVEVEAAESSGTLDAGIYGSDYYKSDSDDRKEQLASSSKRQIESGSDFEEEDHRAKRIKTGLEDLSSSSDSSFTTPEPSPYPTPPTSPQ